MKDSNPAILHKSILPKSTQARYLEIVSYNLEIQALHEWCGASGVAKRTRTANLLDHNQML